MAKRNVFKEAKSLRNKHPRKFQTWAEYVSYAGSHPVRKTKKVMGVKKKKHPTRHRKTPVHHRRRVGRSGVSTNSKTHTDYNRNRVTIHGSRNITVGAVNKHKKAAREKIEHLIGKEEVRLFKTKRKPQKRKIRKKITKLKQDHRRLSL
jgi:hypothetical protein